MSRRKVTTKYFPAPDGTYNSYLVNILISRIVKSGKKTLAQNIVNDTFDVIKYRLNVNPLEIFETAVKNVTPIMYTSALLNVSKLHSVASNKSDRIIIKFLLDNITYEQARKKLY